MDILGTIKMYIDNKILRGRKLVETAVIESETLNNLELLKRWDLVHDSFPFQTVCDYINSKKNKCLKAYSTLYDVQSNLYEESREVKKP